jgi:hypothetical protein
MGDLAIRQLGDLAIRKTMRAPTIFLIAKSPSCPIAGSPLRVATQQMAKGRFEIRKPEPIP